MKPDLGDNDFLMFNNLLNKCSNYFEYGSGGSTYLAFQKENIKNIFSVESDKKWYNKIKSMSLNKKTHKFEYFFIDMNTSPNSFGYPGKLSKKENRILYSECINKLSNNEIKKIDLILIDGRYRVACALKCHKVINNNCLLAFDDFFNREHYKIVLEYFDIIQKTKDNRMVILKKNISKEVPKNIIEKYEDIGYPYIYPDKRAYS